MVRVALLVLPLAELVAKVFMAVKTVCMSESALSAIESAELADSMFFTACVYEAILALQLLAMPSPAGSSLAVLICKVVLMR